MSQPPSSQPEIDFKELTTRHISGCDKFFRAGRQMTTSNPEDLMEAPELVTLFIGLETATNKKSSAAKARALEILSARFPSFTVTESTGFFRGKQESSMVVYIATHAPQEVAECAAVLRVKLDQEGIGVGYRGRYFRATKEGVPKLGGG